MGGFMNEVLGKQKKFQPATEPIDIPPVELKQDDTQGNKVATTTTTTNPVATSTTATTTNNSNGNDNNTPPRGGMMNARVLQMPTPNSVQVQQQGNDGLNATKTTDPEPKYKPVVLPHLEKSQEEKTLEDYIKDIKRLTPEEKEKAYKKAKRKALFSAIGDGVNALANILGTSYGSTYIPQVSLTEGQKKRWDERMNKLKDNEEKYYMYERERARLADNRNLKNMDIDLKNEQSRRETDMANLEYVIKEYGAKSAEAKAAVYQFNAAYAPYKLQAEIDEVNSRIILNQAKTTTEGEKQKTERTTQGKNNALANKYTNEANLANERTKYVGKSTKGTVVITDGETEYELPNNVLENSYVQLYKDIVKDKPDKGKTSHTAAEKWDIVRSYWMESPTAMNTLAKLAIQVDGQEIEEYE